MNYDRILSGAPSSRFGKRPAAARAMCEHTIGPDPIGNAAEAAAVELRNGELTPVPHLK